jgi:hypothetical protein
MLSAYAVDSGIPGRSALHRPHVGGGVSGFVIAALENLSAKFGEKLGRDAPPGLARDDVWKHVAKSLTLPGRPMLFLDSSQIGWTAIPPGDWGEQLMANLILSSIAYQFEAVACARAYAGQARAIALALSGKKVTYRPPRPSRFLRLACETESLLLSVIEGALVAPILHVTRGKSDHILTEGLISTVDFDIEQISLRLKPRRLAEVILPLESMASPKESALVVRSIIADNLRHKLTLAEPLDRAIDFLSLGRDLVGKGNFPLAAVSLEKAEAALNAPLTDMTTAYASGVHAVKEEIARAIDELRRSAL